MSGTLVDIKALVYGSSINDPNDGSRFSGEDQRRVEIALKPRMPASIVGDTPEMIIWTREFVKRHTVDLKHTQRWHCEFCDQPAKETYTMIASWMHRSPPIAIIYVHNICDAGRGPCCDELKMGVRQMTIETGCPPYVPSRLAPINGSYPLAASCAKCQNPETSKGELSRCSQCKLIRYCGTECQKADWSRHKEVCKTVKEVSWVWK